MDNGILQGTSLKPNVGKRLSVGFVLAMIMLLLVSPLASATALPATIEKNTTLTAAGSPYTNAGTVTVKSGVTVTAEPGAELKLGGLTVNGTLKAEGSAEKPVLFTSQTNTGPGQWGGITFASGSGSSVLNHAEVRYTGSGPEGAIALRGSDELPTARRSWRHHGARRC